MLKLSQLLSFRIKRRQILFLALLLLGPTSYLALQIWTDLHSLSWSTTYASAVSEWSEAFVQDIKVPVSYSNESSSPGDSSQWNDTAPPLPHPHAGARDRNGAWGYVADVYAVKQKVLQHYHSSISRGDRTDIERKSYQDSTPSSYLYYHSKEELDYACNTPPRRGIEGVNGWDVLTRIVQVNGSDPLPAENSTWAHPTRKHMDSSDNRIPRILCAVYTYDKRHDVLTGLAETWGWKCDGFFAASTKTTGIDEHPGLGAIDLPHLGEEHYGNMWQKTRSILSYMHDNYKYDFDFFFLSGDDTYLIVENLRRTLQWLGPRAWEWPLYLGQRFPLKSGGYFCGGPSGYVLNLRALEILVKNVIPSCHTERKASYEDRLLGLCFRTVGILGNHTVDANIAERFLGRHPNDVCPPMKGRFWKSIGSLFNRTYGRELDCNSTSSQSVSFHYIRWPLLHMKRIHSILYDSCPKGTMLGDEITS